MRRRKVGTVYDVRPDIGRQGVVMRRAERTIEANLAILGWQMRPTLATRFRRRIRRRHDRKDART